MGKIPKLLSMKTLTIIKIMILLGVIFLTVGILNAQSDPFDYLHSQKLGVDTNRYYPSEDALPSLSSIFVSSRTLVSDTNQIFVPYNTIQYDARGFVGVWSALRRNISPLGGSTEAYWIQSTDNGLTWDSLFKPTQTAGCIYEGYYENGDNDKIAYWARTDASGQHYMYHIVKNPSGDGVTWDSGYGVVNFDVRGTQTGEDASFLTTQSGRFVFFRDSTTQEWGQYGNAGVIGQKPLRRICYGEIIDDNSVNDRQVILPVVRSNFHDTSSIDYRVAFNNMTVTQYNDDYYALVNVIHQASDAIENRPTPTADTCDVRMYHSIDLINWVPMNDTNAIIPLHGNRKQIFSAGSVIKDDTMFIFTEEFNTRHSTYQGGTPPAHYATWNRYKIYMPTLELYKP